MHDGLLDCMRGNLDILRIISDIRATVLKASLCWGRSHPFAHSLRKVLDVFRKQPILPRKAFTDLESCNITSREFVVTRDFP
jgi:hypothetical protein